VAITTVPEEIEEFAKRAWYDLFELYGYTDILNQLRQVYPDTRSMNVSFKDISKIEGFADMILAMPEAMLRIGEDIVRKDYLEKGILPSDSRRFNIRLVDTPLKDTFIEIRSIRSNNIGRLISVTGIVRKNTEVTPRLQNAAFECAFCKSIIYRSQLRGRLEEPEVCTNDECPSEGKKVKFTLLPNESEFVDVQKIEIQENPETMEGGSQPQRIEVIIEDDLTGQLFPGDRALITGVLVAEQKRQGIVPLTEFHTYIYAINHDKDVREITDIEITKEDEKNILELSQKPDVTSLLEGSIAPTIYGHEMIKRALVLQLFGGLRKTMKDGTTIRGDIHILLVGDPGTAKSQLLRYMTLLSPRGIYAAGKGSSAAGLTAAAVRDDFGEGRWTLEAGVLVMANNGLAAIDELDKMDPTDTGAMHEAMEQQSFHGETVLFFSDGSKRTIAEFVDSLMSENQAKVIRRGRAEILRLKDPVYMVSSDSENIFPARITQVSRHRNEGRLIRFSTRGGLQLTVTEDHPMWIYDSGLKAVQASRVRTGDELFVIEESDAGDGNQKGLLLKLSMDSVDSISNMESEDFVYDVTVPSSRTIIANGIMSHNSITISKAGIIATLKSRCSVLAAANPSLGRYDPELSLLEQIKFPPPLLSRFDIIFRIQDKPAIEEDEKLASHVLRVHKMGEMYRGIEAGASKQVDIPDEIEYLPKIDRDLIRKYVAYAKSRVFPRMSEEAMNYIREFYVDARNRHNDTMKITARQLESLIRLSEASARTRLSTVVTENDAILATGILDYYLRDVTTVGGKVDVDMINIGMSQRQRSDLELIITTIRNSTRKDGFITREDLEKLCESKNISKARVDKIVQDLMNDGQVYEGKRPGELKAVL
jgi:replicative DNA helicase Mcm